MASKFEAMTKEQALEYLSEHRDAYIRGFDSIDEGVRAYDCLVVIVEDGVVKPSQLPEYGVE